MTVQLQALVWDFDALTNSLIPLSHNLAIFSLAKTTKPAVAAWLVEKMSLVGVKKKRKNI